MNLTKTPLVDSRMYYLDNIRSIIIVFVVVFHAILPYVQNCPWWYVTDPPPIPYSFYFIVFLEPILMPVLFFISGLLAWPSYNRKGARSFMTGKAKRLIAPFLLCTFFFSPIMPFIRQSLRVTSTGGEPAGFWPFWLGFLKSGTTILSGSASTNPDIVVNQYWFLMLLFVFFAGFCLYASLRGGTENKDPDLVSKSPSSQWGLLGPIAAFCLVTGTVYAIICLFVEGNVWVTLGSLWQIQPAKIPIYLGFFLAGMAIERRHLLPATLRIARPAVWFVAAAMITAAYLTTVIKTAGVPGASWTLVIASRFLRIFLVVTVSLWLLTFFQRRVNTNSSLWRELSANSYNIYLIHMVPLVALQLLFLSWPTLSSIKFGAVSLLTLLLSFLASRFLVKRSANLSILVLILLFIFMSLAFR